MAQRRVLPCLPMPFRLSGQVAGVLLLCQQMLLLWQIITLAY